MSKRVPVIWTSRQDVLNSYVPGLDGPILSDLLSVGTILPYIEFLETAVQKCLRWNHGAGTYNDTIV